MHKFGMLGSASIEVDPTAEQDGDNRKSPRAKVRIAAHVHAAGESQTTVITDISVDGAGLDGAIAIFPGDQVELELSNGRRIPGQVIWWLMGSCGIQFSTPLSENDDVLS